MKHNFDCINPEVVECDDCNKKFCRNCDEESETDFEEGVRRCGLCNALNKQFKRRKD